jgi:hypothetical protein
MYVPAVAVPRTPAEHPPLPGPPVDAEELRRARAAVASIERVRRQLEETQRSLERYIARGTGGRLDAEHPPVRMRTL